MARARGRVVIVHGWNNRPNHGWLGWLADELTARGYEVVAPALPHPHLPRPGEWVKTLEAAVGELDSRTVIVGYSLGTAVALRYLHDYPRDVKIAGLILVAGFGSDLRLQPTGLFRPVLDFDRIRRRAKHRICIYSNNDLVVLPWQSRSLAHRIQAKQVIRLGAGHFIAIPKVLGSMMVLPMVLDAVLSCYPGYGYQRFATWLRGWVSQYIPVRRRRPEDETETAV